ncbi:MAG TPA: hypothetical protein VGG92_16890 [Caulobacteraceae bacterium]|jgi:hypothetical protein
MGLSRREVIGGAAASAPALAFLWAFPAGAAAFDPSRLIGPREAWAELERINREMGPARLTGSPEHTRFVAWLKTELERALTPARGAVFEERFENYPRWTARSWSLRVAGHEVPVASYFPYCTGGFTGARSPLTPAPALAAAGGGGNYPRAGEGRARIIPPAPRAEGQLTDVGVFTGPGSVDWSNAADGIALVRVSVEALSNLVPRDSYTVNGTWQDNHPEAGPYVTFPAPTSTIFSPPDLANATRAGVKGVVLVWQGISAGNAKGQYNPFTVPFSSWPASSPAGSDPTATKGGIPALWVDEEVGRRLAADAKAGAPCFLAIEADIDQVSTSTVWGILPGAHYGQDDEEILVCNTHSDGPNITEENGGVAVVNMARYFAGLPTAERPRTMVFMASTGHFGHRFLGSGRDWIVQHPQIMARTVACLTLEHFGCQEWEDVQEGESLRFAPTGRPLQSQIFVTAPSFQARTPGPASPALRRIVDLALASSTDRAAVLSGGAFLGEGGGFHAAGVPTIGFLPAPQYLCAMADDGEISKLDPAIFHDQLQLSAKCLLSMQSTRAADLKG